MMHCKFKVKKYAKVYKTEKSEKPSGTFSTNSWIYSDRNFDRRFRLEDYDVWVHYDDIQEGSIRVLNEYLARGERMKSARNLVDEEWSELHKNCLCMDCA